jgi:cardiolipin synthase (CMP-forming)
MIFTLPNLLSFLRLCLGLAFPWLPVSWRLWAVLFGAASDLVDGVLSRWLGVEGTVGRILDPVADKVFIVSVVATLLFDEQLALWQVLLVGLRDWTVVGGALVALGRYGSGAVLQMPPSMLGKLTTALQFAFLVVVLVDGPLATLLLAVTAICSGAAAVDYVVQFRLRPVASRGAVE